jgi:predicted PurR-regulated permease PerM
MSEPHVSPPWNRATKIMVVIAALAFILLVAWRFQSILAQFITAVVLAYLLSPLINIIERRTPLSRGLSTIVVYILLVVALAGVLVAVGVAAYQQGVNLLNRAPVFIEETIALVQEWTTDTDLEITIGTLVIPISPVDWDAVLNQALNLVEPVLGQGTVYARQIASSTLQFFTTLVFVFIISAYLANEIPQLGGYINRLAYPAGYQQDAERLMKEFGRIWNSYLRGQVILGLVIFTLVSIALSILGVQNALGLGALAGLLEFVPTLGPVISAIVAMAVAFFQPDNYLGLESWQLALGVVAVMIVIQQVENNFLVPRIVGDALDLHPVLVLIGVLVGASLAGILGAILAAPILASIKLLGIYGWRKLFDLNPFPAEEERAPPQSLRERLAAITRGRSSTPAGDGLESAESATDVSATNVPATEMPVTDPPVGTDQDQKK